MSSVDKGLKDNLSRIWPLSETYKKIYGLNFNQVDEK